MVRISFIAHWAPETKAILDIVRFLNTGVYVVLMLCAYDSHLFSAMSIWLYNNEPANGAYWDRTAWGITGHGTRLSRYTPMLCRYAPSQLRFGNGKKIVAALIQ